MRLPQIFSPTQISSLFELTNHPSMQTKHIARFFILLSILFAHFSLIFIWQKTKEAQIANRQTSKLFLLTSININKTAIPQKPSNKKPTVIKTPLKSSVKANYPKNNQITAQSIPINPDTKSKTKFDNRPIEIPEINETRTPIQKDIRALSMSLREDFLKQEKNYRPDKNSQLATMKKFSDALADAAQIPREGVIIEKKFAYDGRPVSKVKTPYGTYCIRHPKAGEKLELAPPPLPVTCGQL